MKRTVVITMVLILCFASSCSQIGIKKASMADNVNGKWQGVLEEMGGMELFYTFNIEGETLTGSVSSEMGDIPISNGKVTEDSFSFEIDVDSQLIEHNCKYSDGTILMEVPMLENPITLTRVSE
ncbi:glycoside hydrolase [Candidatus Latescibacterota bacterium]